MSKVGESRTWGRQQAYFSSRCRRTMRCSLHVSQCVIRFHRSLSTLNVFSDDMNKAVFKISRLAVNDLISSLKMTVKNVTNQYLCEECDYWCSNKETLKRLLFYIYVIYYRTNGYFPEFQIILLIITSMKNLCG